jgi:hypothetical protein
MQQYEFVLLHGAQPCTNLLKHQVRLRGNQIEQPLPVLLEPQAAVAGAKLRRDATPASSVPQLLQRQQQGESSTMHPTTIGLDLAKHVFKCMALML